MSKGRWKRVEEYLRDNPVVSTGRSGTSNATKPEQNPSPSASPTQAQPPSEPLRAPSPIENIFRFLEHGLFLCLLGVGGPPMLSISKWLLILPMACFALVLHRIGALRVKRLRVQIFWYVIVSIAGAAYGFGFYRAIDAQERELVARIKTAVSGQMPESTPDWLAKVDELICDKDEAGLREAFDFPSMLKYNIRLAHQNLDPVTVSEGEARDTAEFFKGGQSKVNTTFTPMRVVNNRVEFILQDGKVGYMNVSSKYVNQRAALVALYSSAETPAEVAKALKEFDDAIEQNTINMIFSLNESLAADRRNLLETEIPNSPFYGSATGNYWEHHFIHLDPKADAVRSAVRNFEEKKRFPQ